MPMVQIQIPVQSSGTFMSLLPPSITTANLRSRRQHISSQYRIVSAMTILWAHQVRWHTHTNIRPT